MPVDGQTSTGILTYYADMYYGTKKGKVEEVAVDRRRRRREDEGAAADENQGGGEEDNYLKVQQWQATRWLVGGWQCMS